MPSIVTAICYGLGRRFGVPPVVVQLALLVLVFAGFFTYAPGHSSMERTDILIWIGLAVVVVGISRLIDKDWFKVPPAGGL
jgi:hypothetical protein